MANNAIKKIRRREKAVTKGRKGGGEVGAGIGAIFGTKRRALASLKPKRKTKKAKKR
jgi:hypothetical protein